LIAALGHDTTLEAFNLAVRSAFGLEDPARRDGLGSRGQLNQFPSPIASEGEDLLACGSFPVLGVRPSKGFPVRTRVASGRDTCKVIDFTVSTHVVITLILNSRTRFPGFPEGWRSRGELRCKGLAKGRCSERTRCGGSKRGCRCRPWSRSRSRRCRQRNSRCRRRRGGAFRFRIGGICKTATTWYRFRHLPPLPWLL
jgi:hypothetical protein